MSFTLRVGEIIPLRVVQGEAEFTFIRTKMVLHEVRVFIEINGLQGELPQSFPSVEVGLLGGLQAAAAMLTIDAVLVEHRGVSLRWLGSSLRRRAAMASCRGAGECVRAVARAPGAAMRLAGWPVQLAEQRRAS